MPFLIEAEGVENAGKTETAMFAPCGMNCLVCYKHCYHKRPCAGCHKSDLGKPEHCRKCKIKDCAKSGNSPIVLNVAFTHASGQIKALDKSYRTRYHAAL